MHKKKNRIKRSLALILALLMTCPGNAMASITVQAAAVSEQTIGAEEETAPAEAQAEVQGETPEEAPEDVLAETSEDVSAETLENVQAETSEDVPAENPENVQAENPEGAQAETSEGVQPETPEGVQTETPEGVQTETPAEIQTETPEEAPADPVETVRAQIAALPLDMTMEQWQAMTEEEQAALYEKLQAASDAYDALDEAGKAALGDEYARLGAVFEIVNSDVKTMSDSHTCKTAAGADHEFTIALTQAQINTNKKLTTGSYYLKEDLTLTEPLSIESGEVVHLCLNGKTITGANYQSVFYIDYGEPDGQLYLYDCQNSGELTHEKGAEANGVNNYGTFIMEGGKIASNDGGGVYNSGNFTMKAGEISGNSMPNNDGGGVYNSGNFTMENGSITGNSVTGGGYGAGVYNNGTFTMQGGEISGNNGQSQGGGIYNDSDKTCSITGGSIHNNTVSNNNDAGDGGGIYNLGTVTMQDGEIRENNALSSGGGIYNSGGGTCSITGGSIQSNTASQGGGINNRNLLTLNGATITGNTATSYGGGVYNDKTINMGDKNNVTGNTVGDSASNISMESATSMITITGALDAASTVGVREYEAPKTDKPVKFADGAWAYQITENDAATFTSDRGSEVKLEGNTLQMTVKGPVAKKDPVAADFDYTAPADLIFDNWTTRKATVKAKSTATGMGTITVRYYDEKNKEVTSPKDTGTYTVKIDVSEGTSYNAITGLEVGSFTIVYLTTDKVATLDGTLGENGWYTSNPVTITAPDGWYVGLNFNGFGSVYQWKKEGKNSVSYHLKDRGNDHITDEKTIDINIDSVAPSITKVNAASAAITVTARDTTSGIAKYELNVNGTTTTQAVTAGTCTFDVKNLPTGADYPYTVKVTDQAGNASTKTGTLTKTLKTLTKDDFICTLPEDLIYTATEKNITVALASGVSGVGSASFHFEKDGKGANPIEPGTYKVLVTAAEGTKYAAISNLEVAEFTITYLATDQTATLADTNKGEAGWYKGDATLTAPSGWKICLDKKTWGETAQWGQEGEFPTATYYLKDADGHITDGKTVALKLDKTAPVISKVTTAKTTTTANITIDASDVVEGITTSGIAAYTLTGSDGKETIEKTSAGSHTFKLTDLDANKEYIYTVKVQDAAGNQQTKEVKFTTDKNAIASVTPKIMAPVKNGIPATKAVLEQGAHYTASTVNWSTAPKKFLGGTAYTATLTLTPEKDYEFTDTITASIEGSTVTKTQNADGTLTLQAVFPATEARELSSIKVKTAPKTNYTYGDSFDPAGLVLTCTYDDDTTEDVVYSQENQDEFTFTPENLTVDDKTITVTHSGKETSIDITVAKQIVADPEIAAADYTGQLQVPTVATSTLYTVEKNEGGTDAGDYDVVLALTDSTNYKWSDSDTATKNFTFTINQVAQAELTITNQPQTVTYGHAPFTLGTTGGSGDGAVSWKATGSATVDATGKVTITGAKEKVTITATKAADKNHTAEVSAVYTFTVAKKTLTVKAKDHTILYGEKPTGNDVTYEGFVYGETSKVIGGSLSYTYDYQQYGDAGSYHITPGGLSSEDYDIQYEVGTLKVEPREAAFTWNNTATRAYNGKESNVTAAVNNLQKQDDDVTVTVTGGSKVNVGTYAAEITGLTGSKAGNYKLPKNNLTQSYTIVQSASEITEIKAEQTSYVYGDTMKITAKINATGGEKQRGLFAMLAELVIPAKNQVALYRGNTQISEAVTVEKDGNCTLTYETKDKKLPVGTSTLTLKYMGDDNMAAEETTVDVVLNAKEVTAKAAGTMTKVYDGTDTAAVTLSVDAADLVNKNDEVTVTAPAFYNDKNAGSSKAISFNSEEQTVGGAESSYYTVNMPTGVTGEITAKLLNAVVTAENKVYDGTKDATLAAAVETGVTGDSLSISGLAGTFSDKNVGAKKTVTIDSQAVKVTGDAKDNYTILYPAGVTADITKRDVTVKADAKTKVYGGSDPALTFEPKNLVKGETLSGTLTREEGEDVKAGGYAINQGTLTDEANPNYTITFQKGVFTIETAEQETLTIQDGPKNVTYGDAPFTLKAEGGSGTGGITWSTEGPATVNATGKVQITGGGAVTITATKAADGNHTRAVSAVYKVDVAKAVLTVKAKDHTMTYGAEPAGNGVTYDGFVFEDTAKNLGGSLKYTFDYQQYDKVGENYQITPGGLNSDDYQFTYEKGTLTVEPLEAVFTWNNAKERIYDGTASNVTAAVKNIQNKDVVAVTVTGGSETAVGTYQAEITGLTGDKAENYKLPTENLTREYVIKRAASVITDIVTDQASYVYGDMMEITAKVSPDGKVANEKGILAMSARSVKLTAPFANQIALYSGETQISDAVTVGTGGLCTLTYDTKTKKLPVGTSNLTLKYVGNENMADAASPIQVSITAAPVTAKVTSTAITKVYEGTDTAEATLAVDAADLINSADEVTVEAPAAYVDANAGTGKAIVFDGEQKKIGGTEGSYYDVSMPTGVTGDITAKPLNAVVTASEKDYDGDTAAKVTATVETGVKGEDLSISGLKGTFDNKNVGEKKTVTVDSGAAKVTGDSKDNYTITYPGTATADITRRAVTVTAKGQSKNYGAKDPELTFEAKNLVKDETLSGTLTREEGEAVKEGGYAITQGTLTNEENENYSITFVEGKLLINKVAQEELTLDGPEKVTYGDEPFTLKTAGGSGDGEVTWSAEGSAEVDEKGEVTITGAGDVAITAAKAADGNHTEAVSATYRVAVAKKELIVTAKDHTIIYGAEPAGNGVTYDGFVKGDDAEKLGGNLAYDYTYQQYDDVGKDYTITPKGLTSDNYKISYKTGTLTVEQLEAAFTWSNTETRAYDGNPSKVTAAVNNLQNQDVITVEVTGGDEIEEGTHTATITELKGEKSGNYKLPKVLTQEYKIVQSASDITEIIADKESYIYGDVITITANLKPTGNAAEKKGLFARLAELIAPAANQIALYSGKIQISEPVTVDEDGTCAMSYDTMDQQLPMGTSTLTLRYVGNHNMADAVTTINVTIAPKAVEVVAANQTKNYGETDPEFTYIPTGLLGEDTLSGALSREEGEDVKEGGYAITQGTLTDANNPNYSITYTPATLTISPIAQEALTITGMPDTVTYGDEPFTLGTIGGSGKSEVTWTADGPAAVDAAGTVTITGAGKVTVTAVKETDGNYTESVTATATTTAAPKALTWDTKDLTVTTKKHWDGNANASVSGVLKVAGMVGTDDPGFSYTEVVASYENAKAGSHMIAVTATDAKLTNTNYTLPTESITYKGYISSVTQGANQPWQVNGSSTVYRVVLEKGISMVPTGLEQTVFNTPEKITKELRRVLSTNPGYTEKDSIVYDVELQISPDGGKSWTKATRDSFPAEGVKVRVEYPEGTNANDYDFVVAHMFAESMNGHTAGEIESPTATKTADYAEFTVTGLSPIAIAWKPVKKQITNNTSNNAANNAAAGSNTAAKTAYGAQTGDNNKVMQLILLLLISGMSIAFVLVRRRKKSTK
ncbi:MBG domain-containing protein [Hespellia stercorisuis]|uniref:Ig-like domain (Group 3) n=1 Tax=Hespellia stercorisuis DSM 15480 TaxID=1121950 RepID=A0A1M6VP99_9FIRM|nr:MBG domain-containing protein [Hespellia stercorisuis]SHK83165.1 Ig-like domain (group 3) [Hespellia stercorisuis DSM 15480]